MANQLPRLEPSAPPYVGMPRRVAPAPAPGVSPDYASHEYLREYARLLGQGISTPWGGALPLSPGIGARSMGEAASSPVRGAALRGGANALAHMDRVVPSFDPVHGSAKWRLPIFHRMMGDYAERFPGHVKWFQCEADEDGVLMASTDHFCRESHLEWLIACPPGSDRWTAFQQIAHEFGLVIRDCPAQSAALSPPFILIHPIPGMFTLFCLQA